jgi:hypothetical protein
MAKNVQNSHFSFARIFILLENMPLRSSPLLEAAERQAVKKRLFFLQITFFAPPKIQIKAFNEGCFLGC